MTLKQQETALEKIVKGEHWQENLSGLKWSKQLKDAVLLKHLHEIKLWRAQEELPTLKAASTYADLLKLQKRGLPRMIDASCVAVLRSVSDRRIKEVGFNRPDDLFTNNFGTWLAHLIQSPAAAIKGYTMYDTSNTARTSDTVSGYASSYTFNSATSFGTQTQFGSGTTAAARNNYAIQTAFATSPESARFGSGSGSYAGNTVSWGSVIAAGGSGTINEIGLFGYWLWTGTSGVYTFMLTHDILGAGVAFVAGNPLVGTFAVAI